MRTRIQAVIAASLLLLAGLLVAGCAEDYGTDQHGQKVTAERLEGQWLLINYWAEWCAPCRKEIPELNSLADQLQNAGVRVLGVNFDGLQGAALAQASQQMGIGFTVLARDPAAQWQIPRSTVLPVTYIVDPDGRLVRQLPGEQSAAGLRAQLQELGAILP